MSSMRLSSRLRKTEVLLNYGYAYVYYSDPSSIILRSWLLSRQVDGSIRYNRAKNEAEMRRDYEGGRLIEYTKSNIFMDIELSE